MKKKPKILILVPDLDFPGGVANYYKTLSFNSDKDITYFTITKGKSLPLFKIIPRLLSIFFRFYFKLIKSSYRAVITNPSLDERSFYRDLVFIIITRLLNRKTIVFFRGWSEDYEIKINKSKFKSFLFRISYAKADKYFVLGDIFRRKLISMGVPESAHFYTETTVADSSFIPELHLRRKHLNYEKEIRFLFLARMVREKGIYIAIDAFEQFILKLPQRKSKLIIAGDGAELVAVKNYVIKKNIQNIIFLGHIKGVEKKKILLESHVILFPSFTEGLPNTILEGMLYGMPIISRATGGIPEVIKNNRNGFLTESFDPAIFANFLLTIASDSVLYKTISKTNHQTALTQFTIKTVRNRILNVLEEYKY